MSGRKNGGGLDLLVLLVAFILFGPTLAFLAAGSFDATRVILAPYVRPVVMIVAGAAVVRWFWIRSGW